MPNELIEKTEWLIDQGRSILDAVWENQLDRVKAVNDETFGCNHAWQNEMLREQWLYRRRASRRFPDVGRWIFTDKSLSQASDWWSAQFKSQLFPTGSSVVDACCGAGADLVALAARGPVCAIEQDETLALIAASNALAHGYEIEKRVGSVPNALPSDARYLHIDPDRRACEVKTTQAHLFQPTMDRIISMANQAGNAVIKVAPSTLFDDRSEQWINNNASRVWLGNQGECRQQLLLTGETRERFPSSRSVVLCEPGNDLDTRIADTASGDWDDDLHGAVEDVTEGFVYDLHAALHVSGLAASWANSRQLAPITSSAGYYQSAQRIETPLAQAFEVIDIVPWDDRKIRRYLASKKIGAIEVKCRLHRMDASAEQKRLNKRLKGDQNATLLVTRLSKRVRAIIARRISFD